MEKIERLTELLERLNAGEDPVSVKKEMQEFLASISPAELSIAEQELIDAGLAPEDLRHLCSAHMAMLGDELEEMKESLSPGHVIHTLVGEHDMILGFLDKLEEVSQGIKGMESYDSKREEFKMLKHIAEHLVEAELHHQREEEVLFPELEKRGVFGPPHIMRMEHEDLRRQKKELKELAETVDEMGFDVFKEKVEPVAKFIVFTLRDHIFKENNILYPTALQVIQEDLIWDNMKLECDKIGYCCFTPKTEEVRAFSS